MYGTAISTPFDESGINFEEFKKLVEFQIIQGTDAIIVCGTTGESATMSTNEKEDLIKFTVDIVDKRVPVIAGTGSNNTANSIELSKYAESVGADGLLLVTPYYNKTTQQGLIAHYSAIADAVNLPIILYNVPSRTGINILPETYAKLSKINNIVAVKEASGDISQVAKIAQLCGDNLNIYSGNDDQVIPILSLGGLGVISVLSNIYPKFVHNMVINYLNGKHNAALSAQLNSLELINTLFSEVNPIPVKEALNILGFNFGNPRLPLVEMSETAKVKLKQAIEKFAKIAN
ncbi:MAG: 4-hydroxy-tetrahydrodipicolinate synthase [Clostridia bacterium]